MTEWSRVRAMCGTFLLATAALLATHGQGLADHSGWHHATALNGTPKYDATTSHFNYVNPKAPKGGKVRLSSTGGFDSFNAILPKGNLAPGIGLIYETLMEQALDEADVSAQYGVITEETRQRKSNGLPVFSFHCYDSCNWQRAL